jgi:ketosteroid isomerase-like protein
MTQLADQVRDYFRAMDARDFDHVEGMLATDCDFVAPGFSGRGPQAVLGWIQGFMAAFPDVSHELTAIAGDGEIAAVELRVHGTHTAPLQTATGEVPPTGRTLDLPVADIWRVEGGRIVAYHVYFDQMAFLGQLGLLPEPATTA